VIIKTSQQLAQYQQAAKISTEILEQLRLAIKAGVTALEVDALADRLCKQYKVSPNFKGVGPKKNKYQHATCISVNDTVVHGIPDDRIFKKGDLVKVDFGIEYQGLNTDHCFTVGVEQLSPADEKLVRVAKKAVQKACKKAIVANTTGDLGYTMQTVAETAGFSVVREFIGHGIGHSLHEDPQIPAYGSPRSGTRLIEGQVICVEAQIVAGDRRIRIEKDAWTVKTADGSKAAMFEYMLVVGKKKPIYLTKTLDWPIIN
jgi:methionyl aminopeptidase